MMKRRAQPYRLAGSRSFCALVLLVATASLANAQAPSDADFLTIPSTITNQAVTWDWGDFDGDGKIDLIVSDELGTRVYRNEGVAGDELQMALHANLAPGIRHSGKVSWADIDNDGDLDFVLTGGIGPDGRSPFSAIFRNDGGTFSPLDVPLTPLQGSTALWVDIDSDGKLDLLLSGNSAEGLAPVSYVTTLFRNEGEGRFAPLALNPATPALTTIRNKAAIHLSWMDYNGDGRPDLLLSGVLRSTQGALAVTHVYRNDGPGSGGWIFTPIIPVIEASDGSLTEQFAGHGLQQGSLRENRWVHLSGGSILHLASLTNDNLELYQVRPFAETGDRLRFLKIQEQFWLAAAFPFRGVDFVDANGDGLLDLVRSYATDLDCQNGTCVQPGSTTLQLQSATLHDPFGDVDVIAPAGGPMIGVGPFLHPEQIDIAIIGFGDQAPNRRLLRNRAPATPAAPRNLRAVLNGNRATLSWDPVHTLSLPSQDGGLTYNVFIRRPDGRELTAYMAHPQTGQRRVLRQGNAGQSTSFTVNDLPAGRFSWGVQTINESRRASPFIVYGQEPGGPTEGEIFVPAGLLPSTIVGVTEGAHAWADYDGDGDLDLAICGLTSRRVPGGQTDIRRVLELYRNDGRDGDGWKFTQIWEAEKGLVSCTLDWGDYDGDGDLDLLVNGAHANTGADAYITKIYRNDAGTLVDSGIILPQVQGAARFGDYDNDGRLDVAVDGFLLAGTGPRGLYRNDGPDATSPGGWRFTYDTTASETPCTVGASTFRINNLPGGPMVWLDHDNDGNLDLLLTSANISQGRSILLRNEGDGLFTCNPDVLPRMQAERNGLSIGDFDGDGLPDLLVQIVYGTGSFRTRVYRNEGDGTLSEHQELVPYWRGGAAWGDFNNNGQLDAAVAGRGNGFLGVPHVFLNQDDHTLIVDSTTTAILTPGQRWESGHNAVSWADIDNDGDLDLVISGGHRDPLYHMNGWERVTFLFESAASDRHVNAPPTAPSGLSASVEDSVLILGWSPATDDTTPQVALTYNVRVGTTPGGNEIVSGASLPSGYRQVVARGNAGQAMLKRVTGLIEGQTYYWAVQAVDHSYAGSPWSGEQAVVFDPSGSGVLAAPALVEPDDESEDVPTLPRLRWTEVNGALHYTLQISESSDFGSLVVDLGTIPTGSVLLTAPLDVDHEYFWRVQAVGASATSAWSSTYRFRTLSDASRITHVDEEDLIVSDEESGVEIEFEEISEEGSVVITDVDDEPDVPEEYELLVPRRWIIDKDGLGDFSATICFDATEIEDLVDQRTLVRVLKRVSRLFPWEAFGVDWRESPTRICVRGITSFSEFVIVRLAQPVSVQAEELPHSHALFANYPNPFNPSTSIGFATAEAGLVTLTIHDVLGREIAVLVDGLTPAGRHEVRWDASDVASGIYLYRLRLDGFTQTRRMALVK